MSNKIRQLWEERSNKYKDNVKGVLPKSFPNWLNKILDNWMFSKVKMAVKKGDFVLDLGCGYGRVSSEILSNIKDTKIIGIDISQNYVDIFNSNLSPRGRAYRGSIEKLTFKDKSFDSVVMITTMMYVVDEKMRQNTMKQIFRILKTNSKFIFIERNPYGHSLMTLGGLITKIRGNKNKEIKSVSFEGQYFKNLINKSGGKVVSMSGFPFGIFLMPSLYIAYYGTKK